MNIDNRIRRLEVIVRPDIVLSQEDRVRVIFVPADCVDQEAYVTAEKQRFFQELHDKYGDFDESSLTLITVVFVHPFANTRERGIDL